MNAKFTEKQRGHTRGSNSILNENITKRASKTKQHQRTYGVTRCTLTTFNLVTFNRHKSRILSYYPPFPPFIVRPGTVLVVYRRAQHDSKNKLLAGISPVSTSSNVSCQHLDAYSTSTVPQRIPDTKYHDGNTRTLLPHLSSANPFRRIVRCYSSPRHSIYLSSKQPRSATLHKTPPPFEFLGLP